MAYGDYDYKEAVKSDIEDYIEENIDYIKDEVDITDKDAVMEYLNDALWIEDSVTGNGSGSYTFSRAKAEEYVKNDPRAKGYIQDMCEEWGTDAATIGEKFMDDDWEYFDVSIRCFLLSEAIYEVIEEEDYLDKVLGE